MALAEEVRLRQASREIEEVFFCPSVRNYHKHLCPHSSEQSFGESPSIVPHTDSNFCRYIVRVFIWCMLLCAATAPLKLSSCDGVFVERGFEDSLWS